MDSQILDRKPEWFWSISKSKICTRTKILHYVKSCVTFESFALKYSTFIQANFVHQVINTPIAMENIAVKPKWRNMTHWVVTMVNYVMEAKSASRVGAVRMMPITNVPTKSVEIINQVKFQKISISHKKNLTFFILTFFNTEIRTENNEYK